MERAARQYMAVFFFVAVSLSLIASLLAARIPRNELPGWSDAEYDWRVTSVTRNDTAFIGDSRVGWGLAEEVVTKELMARQISGRAFNLGYGSGGLIELLDYLAARRMERPRLLVLAVSPASLFDFTGSPSIPSNGVHPLMDVHMKPVLDRFLPGGYRRIIQGLQSFWVPPPARLVWSNRVVHREGVVNAELRWTDDQPFDVGEYQLQSYAKIIASMPGASDRRIRLIAKIRTLQADGWRVSMIRMPVGKRMRDIEMGIPETLSFRGIAEDAGVQLIDYTEDHRTRDLPTIDQSHLTVPAARDFAAIVARDLAH